MKVLGDAAFVPLTRKLSSSLRRYALVDLDDFERVSKSKWFAKLGGANTYIKATSATHLAAHHMLLHAYILRVKPGERVDHINGDKADNRKQNLRLASVSQNAMNMKRPTFPGKTSRFKGVSWSATDERWHVQITAKGETFRLGLFPSEEDAARAYDAAAVERHGEFARTNEVMRLFEMDDPFEPNCSLADVFDRHVDASHHHQMVRNIGYDQRLTARLKEELQA